MIKKLSSQTKILVSIIVSLVVATPLLLGVQTAQAAKCSDGTPIPDSTVAGGTESSFCIPFGGVAASSTCGSTNTTTGQCTTPPPTDCSSTATTTTPTTNL